MRMRSLRVSTDLNYHWYHCSWCRSALVPRAVTAGLPGPPWRPFLALQCSYESAGQYPASSYPAAAGARRGGLVGRGFEHGAARLWGWTAVLSLFWQAQTRRHQPPAARGGGQPGPAARGAAARLTRARTTWIDRKPAWFSARPAARPARVHSRPAIDPQGALRRIAPKGGGQRAPLGKSGPRRSSAPCASLR